MKTFRGQRICWLLLLLVVGCSQEGTSESAVNPDVAVEQVATSSPDSFAYQKPGASVRFRHDFDGQLEPGQSETVSLLFSEAYDAGSLSLSFSADAGLEYRLLQTPVFDLQSTAEHGLTIDLSAQNPGRYYLRIFAEVMLPQGQPDRRVFGLAVDVGNEGDKTEEEGEAMAKDFRGEELILLPARENRKE